MIKRLCCLAIFLIFILASPLNAQWVRSFQNWTRITALAQRGSTVFAGSWDGLLFSTDNGNSWQKASAMSHSTVETLAVDDSDVFAGTGGSGLFRSTRIDTAWQLVHAPSLYQVITSLWVNHSSVNGSSLLIGVGRSGVSQSTDRGSTWTYLGLSMWNIPTGVGINYVAQADQFLYAGSFFRGVSHSGDYGKTWSTFSGASAGLMDLGITGLVVNGGYVFTSAGKGTSSYKGVYRSSDHGSTWEKCSDGLTNLNVLSIAVSGSRLFAGTSVGGVFLSTNNGNSWSSISTGLPSDDITALTVGSDQSGNGFLFAGTSVTGIWRLPLSEVVLVDRENQLPQEFSLGQNYPNPFNPSTTIHYELPQAGFVSLKVFNTLGQIAATVVNQSENAGIHEVTWNAVNIPSGIYFYRLQARQTDGGQAGEFVETKKMLLLK